MAVAVGVVFARGGKVYSFDPGGLDLAWNEKVVCQTSRGQEFGRVVKANHELPDEGLTLKKVVRRATETDEETDRENRAEAKRSMLVFREVMRAQRTWKPVAAELVFDGSRIVFSATGRRAGPI